MIFSAFVTRASGYGRNKALRIELEKDIQVLDYTELKGEFDKMTTLNNKIVLLALREYNQDDILGDENDYIKGLNSNFDVLKFNYVAAAINKFINAHELKDIDIEDLEVRIVDLISKIDYNDSFNSLNDVILELVELLKDLDSHVINYI